jgi:hypothetical protein
VSSFPYTSRQHFPVGLTALYAGGDLPWTLRLKMKKHLRRCDECAHQVDAFRAATTELRREAETNVLTGFEAIADWSRLEREITGNIAVGVAAARCVDKVRPRGSLWLRVSFTLGLGVLFTAGWVTHIPAEDNARLLASLRQWIGMETSASMDTVLRTAPDSIAVRTQGTTLKLIHPRSAITSISGSSSVEARYVDEETGQVTITSVYGQ